jgi:Holliday junction DNA helicase RuvA
VRLSRIIDDKRKKFKYMPPMIAYLRGTVIHCDLDALIIRSGDVGYQVYCTKEILARFSSSLPADGTFWTVMITREDGQTLYGFETPLACRFFRLLTSVQGVGSRGALNLLNLGLETLIQALQEGDDTMLMRADGVGKKLATRLLNETTDKLPKILTNVPQVYSTKLSTARPEHQEARQALLQLGFSQGEIQKALLHVCKDQETHGTLEEIVRDSLNFLRSA